jgi:hypothetical protein
LPNFLERLNPSIALQTHFILPKVPVTEKIDLFGNMRFRWVKIDLYSSVGFQMLQKVGQESREIVSDNFKT